MTSTTALAEALIVASTAIFEVMPAPHQQIVSSIVRGAIGNGLVRDCDTIRLLAPLLDSPPRRRRSLARTPRARRQ